MTLEACFNTIESLRFVTQFTVLSNFNSVRRNIENDETVQQLISLMQNAPSATHRVYERIQTLLHDTGAIKDIDEPLTAYLYALSRVDKTLIQSAAVQLIQVPHLFWARHMAEYFLTQQQPAQE